MNTSHDTLLVASTLFQLKLPFSSSIFLMKCHFCTICIRRLIFPHSKYIPNMTRIAKILWLLLYMQFSVKYFLVFSICSLINVERILIVRWKCEKYLYISRHGIFLSPTESLIHCKYSDPTVINYLTIIFISKITELYSTRTLLFG